MAAQVGVPSAASCNSCCCSAVTLAWLLLADATRAAIICRRRLSGTDDPGELSRQPAVQPVVQSPAAEHQRSASHSRPVHRWSSARRGASLSSSTMISAIGCGRCRPETRWLDEPRYRRCVAGRARNTERHLVRAASRRGTPPAAEKTKVPDQWIRRCVGCADTSFSKTLHARCIRPPVSCRRMEPFDRFCKDTSMA